MTENENLEENKDAPKREYVALTPGASERINRWIEQVSAKKKIKASRKAFISWYIENAPENLSNKEVASAIERFYKTTDYLRQLLREAKQAETEGTAEPDIEVVVRAKRVEPKKDEDQILPSAD